MATARELELRPGDVARIGTHRYIESSRVCTNEDLDMSDGPRVEVLGFGEDGSVRLRYLDDAKKFVRRDRHGTYHQEPDKRVGYEDSFWSGYAGFIPDSVQRSSGGKGLGITLP